MTEYTYMGMAFYVTTFLVCATCIIYTFIQNRTDRLQKKLYITMVSLLLINSVSEAVIEAATPYRASNATAQSLILLCKLLYFAVHSSLLPVLGYYVLSITGRINVFTPKKHVLFNLPILAIELFMLTNPLHHQFYRFEGEAFEYHRGWGVTVLYIVSAYYILYFVINLFGSWRAMTAKRRMALVYFLSMVVAGILVQMLVIKLRVELFAESLAFLGVLLTIEDEGDLIDTEVGIYNRKALQIDLDTLLANHRSFNVICLKIENPDAVRRSTGSANTEILTSMIVGELLNYLPRYCIYQTAPGTFVMTVIKEGDERAAEIANRISDRFERSWSCGRSDVVLSATTMLAKMPDDVPLVADIFDMADGDLPYDRRKRMFGKEALSYLLRRRAVESAVQRGLEQNCFEVYYQPTYRIGGAVAGAEALLRLHDKRLGNVPPDEFIPVAEKIGLIGEVDDFVLRTVCGFIRSGVPDRLGIESINVNLSVLQCIKPGFAEHIVGIVDEYGVDRSRVNFELTESVDSGDYAIMESVIKQFRQFGFHVYMDDFGTGYSNIQALFSMDFDVVKIDKSILWWAEKSKLGMVVLSGNINMLKEMHIGILVEGVETAEQAELLKKLGADYLQGFFFSKPLCTDDLIRKLS